MSEPRAIPTEYNGVRYRSRLEARWAVFFLTLDLAAEYEPRGTEFYTPDFWLPALGLFVEVKPDAAPPRAQDKVEQLVRARHAPVVILAGDEPHVGPFIYCWWFSPHGETERNAWPMWERAASWRECGSCATLALVGQVRCDCAAAPGRRRLDTALYASTRIRFR